jgi:hypothetical protein
LSKGGFGMDSENLLPVLAPLVFMFGSALFLVLLDMIVFPFAQLKAMTTAVFCALCCSGLIFAFLPPRSLPWAYPPYYPPFIQLSASWMKDSELMMSDMPWAVAWYGDRSCIWTTLEDEEDLFANFYAINESQKTISAIYITRMTTDGKFASEIIRGGQDWAWGRFVLFSVLQTNLPKAFPLNQAVGGLLPDELFLSDRKRWQEKRDPKLR